MDEKKKSAEQTALGDELDKILGPNEFKALGEDLAFVIAKHKLTREPETCEKVFRYMPFVIFGWSCEQSGQENLSLENISLDPRYKLKICPYKTSVCILGLAYVEAVLRFQ